MARAPTTPSNYSLVPTLGSGWHFPIVHELSSDGPRLAMASDELSVRQSIEIILSTAKGERVMRPDFGCDIDRFLFAPNNGTTRALVEFEVNEALKAWEPRIETFNVGAHAAGENGELLLINIDYRVRSTDNRFNLVYPFYLNRALT